METSEVPEGTDEGSPVVGELEADVVAMEEAGALLSLSSANVAEAAVSGGLRTALAIDRFGAESPSSERIAASAPLLSDMTHIGRAQMALLRRNWVYFIKLPKMIFYLSCALLCYSPRHRHTRGVGGLSQWQWASLLFALALAFAAANVASVVCMHRSNSVSHFAESVFQYLLSIAGFCLSIRLGFLLLVSENGHYYLRVVWMFALAIVSFIGSVAFHLVPRFYFESEYALCKSRATPMICGKHRYRCFPDGMYQVAASRVVADASGITEANHIAGLCPKVFPFSIFYDVAPVVLFSLCFLVALCLYCANLVL